MKSEGGLEFKRYLDVFKERRIIEQQGSSTISWHFPNNLAPLKLVSLYPKIIPSNVLKGILSLLLFLIINK